jgi:hypothetical protein
MSRIARDVALPLRFTGSPNPVALAPESAVPEMLSVEAIALADAEEITSP